MADTSTAEMSEPFPGMAAAFEDHFSQSWIDQAWRTEASVWAAAWKAATRAALAAQPVTQSVEPLVWESTTSAYIKFITDSRYRKFAPAVQKWYRPVCQKCAQSVEPVAWRITDGEGGYNYSEDEPAQFSKDWSARYGRKHEPLYDAPQVPSVSQEPKIDFAAYGGLAVFRETTPSNYKHAAAASVSQSISRTEAAQIAEDAAIRYAGGEVVNFKALFEPPSHHGKEPTA